MNFEKQPPNALDGVSQGLLSQTPIHFACYKGDEHMLDSLIGKTFLYNKDGEAASACVSALVSEEDGINGWTPAHWASYYGQLGCLMKLHVKPHLGFDTPSHRSNTSPLHLAAQSGAVLCLKWLLQCGASKNRQDFMGETALHKASKSGNTDTAAMLVAHGASIDVKNHRGMTPVNLAEEANHSALAQYLRRMSEHVACGNSDELKSSPLPISDLNPSPPYSPFNFPLPHRGREVDLLACGECDRLNPYIYMNGETIHNSDMTDNAEEMDQSDTETVRIWPLDGHSTNRLDSFSSHDGCFASSPAVYGGVKRSLEETGEQNTSIHKRACFVPASQKSHEERYGDAYNNNIISSYNAVLAMRVEPLHSSYGGAEVCSKHDSPDRLPSSVIEHQDSVMAEHGYDNTLMNNISSAFH